MEGFRFVGKNVCSNRGNLDLDGPKLEAKSLAINSPPDRRPAMLKRNQSLSQTSW